MATLGRKHMRRTIVWAALLALVLVATGTTSYAALKYVITSSKQVKNGSLDHRGSLPGRSQQLHGRPDRLARRAHRALSVLSVPRADRPGHAYADALTTTVADRGVDQRDAVQRGRRRPARTWSPPASRDRPATRPTRATTSASTATSPGRDELRRSTYRVGMDPNVERYLTFEGAGTTTGAGTIALTCYAGNGHPLS